MKMKHKNKNIKPDSCENCGDSTCDIFYSHLLRMWVCRKCYAPLVAAFISKRAAVVVVVIVLISQIL